MCAGLGGISASLASEQLTETHATDDNVNRVEVAELPPQIDSALCDQRLDELVAGARSVRAAATEAGLRALADECTSHPQIEHDLAAFALGRGDWEGALAHLERSIELDPRAHETLEALRAIHRYRAARAYADVLGSAVRRGPTPVIDLQDSRDVNSDSQRRAARVERMAELRDESAIDYELYAWWSSGRDGRQAEYVRHYASELRAPQPNRSLPDWGTVRRDIVLASEDAVVTLIWTSEDDVPEQRLLLLRLEDERWKIYVERVL